MSSTFVLQCLTAAMRIILGRSRVIQFMAGLIARTKIGFFSTGYRTFASVNALRIFSILLFCLRLLLPVQTVVELFKLPFLVSHFLHHHHTEGNSPVFEFMAEHYGSHDHHEQDGAEHKAHHKLPFGSHHTDDLKQSIQPFLSVSGPTYPTIKLPALPLQQMFIRVGQWHSQFSPSIWQPPKIG